jgi:hypothetical protein
VRSERRLNVGCRPEEADSDQEAGAVQHEGCPLPRPFRNGLNRHRCLQVPLELSQHQARIELNRLRVRASVSPTVETARQRLEAILFECFQVSPGNLRLVADLLECETPSGTGTSQQLTKPADMVLGGGGVRMGLGASEACEGCSQCRLPSCVGRGVSVAGLLLQHPARHLPRPRNQGSDCCRQGQLCKATRNLSVQEGTTLTRHSSGVSCCRPKMRPAPVAHSLR